MLEVFHQAFDEAQPQPQMLKGGVAMQVAQHLVNRAAPGGLPILDLHCDEVTRHMDAVIEKIYAFADMPLSDTARERMRRWGADHPIHGKGDFRDSLEAFGLSQAQIHRDFADYLECIDAKFGSTGV